MSFDMINELLVAEFAKTLIVNSTGKGLPFKVEEVGSIRLLPGREILWHRGFYLRHETVLLFGIVRG